MRTMSIGNPGRPPYVTLMYHQDEYKQRQKKQQQQQTTTTTTTTTTTLMAIELLSSDKGKSNDSPVLRYDFK